MPPRASDHTHIRAQTDRGEERKHQPGCSDVSNVTGTPPACMMVIKQRKRGRCTRARIETGLLGGLVQRYRKNQRQRHVPANESASPSISCNLARANPLRITIHAGRR